MSTVQDCPGGRVGRANTQKDNGGIRRLTGFSVLLKGVFSWKEDRDRRQLNLSPTSSRVNIITV